VIEGLASTDDVFRGARAAWRPPPRLSLSEWADAKFYLSAESSAQVGRWSTLPYQRGIMDAMTDPAVTYVSLMKSARVGYTKMIDAFIGYSIDQDPCPVLVVQPTVDDAKGFSKEEIAPMLRDCPDLARIVFEEAEEAGPRDSGNTILHKKFPGGVLSLVGANSGAGLRRISRKRVLFDEVDGYPPSAGSDGDPIKLGIKRTEYYWDRKIVAGSTPLLAGTSRIEQLYLQGDQRRYYVPCPHCGHFDFLVFSERKGGGHFMQWPEGDPGAAYFVCSRGGCVIEHHQKRDMVSRGAWRAAAPFTGHASFHIWAAYSYSPNATWGHLAAEFLEAKRGGPEQLKTFVNTVLGETWQEQGEAPDWERLYQRREQYQIGTMPERARFLTAGVDVQKDRFVYEVVGWAPGRESWSVEAGVLPCDTALDASWLALDELLNREWPGSTRAHRLAMLAVDSGYNTQTVYNWVRRHERNRVIAVKGVTSARALVSAPTPVDVMHNGQRIARGAKVWPLGVDVAKSELYGFLRLHADPGAPFPPGFCHFPEHGPDYFKQLTAEHLVRVVRRTGHTILEWQVLSGRENHWLDCRVYARAAASVCGLDRMAAPRAPAAAAPAAPGAVPVATPAAAPAPAPAERRRRPIPDSRFSGGRGNRWFGRR
jgi:terminase, large subunit